MEEKSFYAFREKGSQTRFQSFALEIVAGCQLRCGNCYRPPHKKIDAMPSDFILKAIREARAMGFAEIVFIGGEPTLHPDLPLCIAEARQEGLAIILCTNGLKLADKEYCQRLVQEGTTVVIHGMTNVPKEIMDWHVNIAGYNGKLTKAYANLNELRQSRGFTIVSEAVVIKPFVPYLLDFHKWCRQSGYIPFIEMNRRGDNSQGNALSVSPEELREIFCRLQEWDRQNFPALADALLSPPAYGNKCTMSITGFHVKNFGNGQYGGVYSCCAQSVCHGDLRKKSLQEIISDESVRVFKEQDDWIFGPCRECADYAVCRGGCRGEAALAFGCPRASCPACWRIPLEVRKNASKMRPANCLACPLEHFLWCRKS